MSISGHKQKSRKVCFVTVGATANFDSLIMATLDPRFLEALKAHDYTELRLQHGNDQQRVLEKIRESKDTMNEGMQDLSISGFDFKKQGLGSDMRAAKGDGNGVEGVVISHAGIIDLGVIISEAPVFTRFGQDQALSSTPYE